MKSDLGARVRAQVEPAASEERLQRSWQAIAARRAVSTRRTARTRALTIGALAACVATGLWLGLERATPSMSPERVTAGATSPEGVTGRGVSPEGVTGREVSPEGVTARGEGALSMADGRPLVVGPGVQVLADGSRIETSADGAITPHLNDGHALRLSLERGRARFDVQPGGPRRWTIDAGICEVEVVGTSFVVDRRSDGRVRVEVDHGRVRVRGEGIAGGEAMLGAGDVLEVEPRGSRAAVEPGTEPGVEASTSAAVAIDADALLARADAARAEGRPWDAAIALRRFVRERADDPRAGIIALTLARVELDELDHPRAAARACELALRLGLGGDMGELARARRVEAWARAGDGDAAARAARDYLAHHPEGAWAERVRAWSE